MTKTANELIDRWISELELFLKEKSSPIELENLTELIDIRNKFYNDIPEPNGDFNTGVTLIDMMRWHVNDLDNFISRWHKYKTQPEDTNN